MATLDIRVAASTDDCTRTDVNTDTTLIYNWLGQVNNGHDDCGTRYLNVTVPKNAAIVTAYVTFTQEYNYTGAPCQLTTQGQAADNAPTFINSNADFDGRPRTTARVNWNAGGGGVGTTFNSDELKTVIQEIVNRSGWVSGNALVLFFKDNSSPVGNYRGVYSYDGSTTKAPLLHIEYSTTTVNDTVTISSAAAIKIFGETAAIASDATIKVSATKTINSDATIEGLKTVSSDAEIFSHIIANASIIISESVSTYSDTIIARPHGYFQYAEAQFTPYTTTDLGPNFATKANFPGTPGQILLSISANISQFITPSTQNIQFGIYSDNGGAPGSPSVQLALTNIVPITLGAATWATLFINSTFALIPNTSYWLAISCSEIGGNFGDITVANNSGYYYYTSPASTSLAPPLTLPALGPVQSKSLMMYGTYGDTDPDARKISSDALITIQIPSDAKIVPCIHSDATIIYTRGQIRHSSPSTLIFDTSNGAIPKILRLNNSDYYSIVSYDGNTDAGTLRTAHITTNGVIDSAVTDAWQFSSYGVTPAIAHISGSIYSITSQTSAATGAVSTVSITNTGDIAHSFIDTLSFGSTNPYSYTLPVANSVYTTAIGDGLLQTYTVHTTGAIDNSIIDSFNWGIEAPYGFVNTTFGYFVISHNERTIKTVQIAQSGSITPDVISTWLFEPAVGSTPHIIHVFHNVYAVVYENLNGGCTINTFTIRPEDGEILGPIDTFELDAVAGTVPRIYHVGGDVYVVIYSTPLLAGRLTTIGISFDGLIQQSIIDTFDYDTTRGYWPDLAFISDQDIFGSLFALTYWGPTNDGVLKTVRIRGGVAYPTESSTTINAAAVISGRSIFSDAYITKILYSDAVIYDNIRANAVIYDNIKSGAHIQGRIYLNSDAIIWPSIRADAIIFSYIRSDAHTYVHDETLTTQSDAVIWPNVRSNTQILDNIRSDARVQGRAYLDSTAIIWPNIRANAEIYPNLRSNAYVEFRESTQSTAVIYDNIRATAEICPYIFSNASIIHYDTITAHADATIYDNISADAQVYDNIRANAYVEFRVSLQADALIYDLIRSDAQVYDLIRSDSYIQYRAHVQSDTTIYDNIRADAFIFDNLKSDASIYRINDTTTIFSDTAIWPNLKSDTNVFGINSLRSNAIIKNTLWKIERDMPTAGASGGSILTADSKLFTFGVDGTQVVQEYDPYSNAWTYRPNMPTARVGAAVAELNRQLYVISGGVSTANEMFTPRLNTWTTLASVPEGRSGASAVSVQGKIYVLGGDTLSASRRNDEYDPITNKWTNKANIPQRRGYSAIATCNDKIYVISGKSSTGTFYTDHTIYTPATDTWELGASIPVAVVGARAVVLYGDIYIIGGMRDDSSISASVQVYHTATDTWDAILWPPDMHFARYNFAAGVVDGLILVAGGDIGSALPNSTESFNALTFGNILSTAEVIIPITRTSDADVKYIETRPSDADIYIVYTTSIGSDASVYSPEMVSIQSNSLIHDVPTNIVSNATIFISGITTIDSNAVVIRSESISLSSDAISVVFDIAALSSDALVQVLATTSLSSVAIIQVSESVSINSDALVVYVEVVDIQSDTNTFVQDETARIHSNAVVYTTETINTQSTAVVFISELNSISSDAEIAVKLLHSDAFIVQITRAAVMVQPDQMPVPERIDSVLSRNGIRIV